MDITLSFKESFSLTGWKSVTQKMMERFVWTLISLGGLHSHRFCIAVTRKSLFAPRGILATELRVTAHKIKLPCHQNRNLVSSFSNTSIGVTDLCGPFPLTHRVCTMTLKCWLFLLNAFCGVFTRRVCEFDVTKPQRHLMWQARPGWMDELYSTHNTTSSSSVVARVNVCVYDEYNRFHCSTTFSLNFVDIRF